MARTKSTARIVPAKHNGIKFQALCAALRRNDRTVTAVTATSRGFTPHAYGRRLGMALRHNTTVTKIDLHLGFLLSGKSTTVSASTLRRWIQACPSLHTVTLQSRYPHNWSQYGINNVQLALLQQILQAAAQNPAIQAIALPCLEHVQTTVWTGYLANDHAVSHKIQSLTLVIPNEASDAELDAAAQAVAALPRLKELSLAGTNAECILRELQSDRCAVQLTHLKLSNEDGSRPKEYPESTMTLLSNVVRKSIQLQHLTLHHLKLKVEGWRLVSAALQTNPSVNELIINDVSFTKEALKLILNDMQCNDELKQHIRRLTLSFYDVTCRAKHLALALCSGECLIRHLSIRTHLMEDKAFFRIWRQHAATLPLESLHMGGVTHDMLQDMARILADTVHLRRLTCQMSSYPRKNIEVPHSFLVAVQRNGCLHEMTLQYWNWVDVRITPDQTKNEAIARIMKAITLRNRHLPNLITRAFETPPANRSTCAGNDRLLTGTSSARQFPELCVVATTAPRMAPNTVLKGLLPTLDALRPIRLRDAKRACNNHL